MPWVKGWTHNLPNSCCRRDTADGRPQSTCYNPRCPTGPMLLLLLLCPAGHPGAAAAAGLYSSRCGAICDSRVSWTGTVLHLSANPRLCMLTHSTWHTSGAALAAVIGTVAAGGQGRPTLSQRSKASKHSTDAVQVMLHCHARTALVFTAVG
jgi:hypothetical protein